MSVSDGTTQLAKVEFQPPLVVVTADVFQFFYKKEMRTVVGYRADGRENDLSGMTTATCGAAGWDENKPR